ncbi:MAG: GtrA family protein [Sphingomonadaceae bacterium]|nr:GtrA family protein [Sphingomonadaceae bacterium]
MLRYWQGLDEGQRALLAQLLRYGITGGGVTALSTMVYWICAKRDGPLRIAPLLANVIAYLVAVAIGYVVHSRWSFRGHGRRDNPARTTFRFVIVSLLSLVLNSFWVWLLTVHIKGATWWPIPLMVMATPIVLFWLNRKWVFD